MGAYVPSANIFPLQVASDEETFCLSHKDGMSLKCLLHCKILRVELSSDETCEASS